MRDSWGRRLALLVLGALTVLVGCGDDDEDASPTDSIEIGGPAFARGPEAWPRPDADQVAELVEDAGLQLELKEHLAHHVHAHLDVFIDGEHRWCRPGSAS